MPDSHSTAQLPDTIWDSHQYTSIHAAVIFADLENSVMISSALAPADYDTLISDFQSVMLELVSSLKQQGLPVSEYYVTGDQLALFLYDPGEVERNWQLDNPASQISEDERQEMVRGCRKVNENLTFMAFKAAVQLKNLWLAQSFNTRRVLGYREALGLGIGMHYGRVFLRNRPGGHRRIEGYTLNLAKRIEGFSRHGLYSRIMLSQECHDILREAVVLHTQLRQRIFFYYHLVESELLKGLTQHQKVYELKFFHRLGLPTPEGLHTQYETLFAVDRTNCWAYYQLFDNYAYRLQEWEKAFELAKIAHVANPRDEKILLDLAKCYQHFGQLDQSANLAEHALSLNSEFDLAHELLADLASAREDMPSMIQHMRDAVRLSPSSPVNVFNLGLALLNSDNASEGMLHVREAVRMYPDYLMRKDFQQGLSKLHETGKLPAELQDLLVTE